MDKIRQITIIIPILFSVFCAEISEATALLPGLTLHKEKDSVVVLDVQRGSKVWEVGIKKGDILLKIDGQEIKILDDYVKKTKSTSRDETVTLIFLRHGEEYVIIKDSNNYHKKNNVIEQSETGRETFKKLVPADEKYDFRKVRWGMTKDEVKASESNKKIDEVDDGIVYLCEAAGLECNLGYFFAKGRLVKTAYIFQEKYSNKNNHISDFEKIKKILTQKYGVPTFYDQQWRNDLYKDSPQDWGLAVSISHLMYSSKWESETTEIELDLVGNNYRVIHGVFFNSKKLIHLLEEKKQKKEQEDF